MQAAGNRNRRFFSSYLAASVKIFMQGAVRLAVRVLLDARNK
jgi:hypothetical protein